MDKRRCGREFCNYCLLDFILNNNLFRLHYETTYIMLAKTALNNVTYKKVVHITVTQFNWNKSRVVRLSVVRSVVWRVLLFTYRDPSMARTSRSEPCPVAPVPRTHWQPDSQPDENGWHLLLIELVTLLQES